MFVFQSRHLIVPIVLLTSGVPGMSLRKSNQPYSHQMIFDVSKLLQHIGFS